MRPPIQLLVQGHLAERRDSLATALVSRGYHARVAAMDDPEHASAAPADILLLVGEEAAAAWRSRTPGGPGVPAIVVDHEAQLERAVLALRSGAADYVSGDLGVDAVEAAIRRVSERCELAERLRGPRPEAQSPSNAEPSLVGESPALCAVRERIERLRGSDATVLLTGESGTGKEVAARVLHRTSARCHGPFVAVNCGAIPDHLVESEFFGHVRGAFTDATTTRPGLLAQAGGGTLFLDEISSMPLGAQAKVLRALQERSARQLGQGKEVQFDVRIVAASEVDLGAEVAMGRFRQDLFFRLNVVLVHLPPLRERGLDTLLLAQHFILRFAVASGKRVVGMTTGAARKLLGYGWPGNVRELSNCMEAAVALARYDHVTDGDLGPAVRASSSVRAREAGDPAPEEPMDLGSWSDLEARHIAATLHDAGGNKARAARLLGIDRKTLYRKLRRYDLR